MADIPEPVFDIGQTECTLELQSARKERLVIEAAIKTLNKMLTWCLVALENDRLFAALAQPLLQAYYGHHPAVRGILISRLQILLASAHAKYFDVNDIKTEWSVIKHLPTPQRVVTDKADERPPIKVRFSTTSIDGNARRLACCSGNSIVIAVYDTKLIRDTWRSIEHAFPDHNTPIDDLARNIEGLLLHEMTHAILQTIDMSLNDGVTSIRCYSVEQCQRLTRCHDMIPTYKNAQNASFFVCLLYIKMRLPEVDLTGTHAIPMAPQMPWSELMDMSTEIMAEVEKADADK